MTDMHALIVDTVDAPFRLTTMPKPVAGTGQVLVRIRASGLNPLDGKIRAGQAAHARQPLPAVLGVALGGRGTLIGPLLGAGVVNGMKSWFTVAFPEYWLFFLGALFIIVTLYLPKGVIGLLKKRDDQ